jgi:hypothetical protein
VKSCRAQGGSGGLPTRRSKGSTPCLAGHVWAPPHLDGLSPPPSSAVDARRRRTARMPSRRRGERGPQPHERRATARDPCPLSLAHGRDGGRFRRAHRNAPMTCGPGVAWAPRPRLNDKRGCHYPSRRCLLLCFRLVYRSE